MNSPSGCNREPHCVLGGDAFLDLSFGKAIETRIRRETKDETQRQGLKNMAMQRWADTIKPTYRGRPIMSPIQLGIEDVSFNFFEHVDPMLIQVGRCKSLRLFLPVPPVHEITQENSS